MPSSWSLPLNLLSNEHLPLPERITHAMTSWFSSVGTSGLGVCLCARSWKTRLQGRYHSRSRLGSFGVGACVFICTSMKSASDAIPWLRTPYFRDRVPYFDWSSLLRRGLLLLACEPGDVTATPELWLWHISHWRFSSSLTTHAFMLTG